MNIRRATVGLTVLLLAAIVTGGGPRRSTAVRARWYGAVATQAEPTLNTSFGFPVWIYLNSSSEGVAPTRAVYIYLFAEPQHFRESDLRTLFGGLAAEYPRPATLWVTAASDRDFLRRKIKVHLAGVPRCTFPTRSSDRQEREEPDSLPVDRGCFLAEYIRMEGHEEAFDYNPDPHKVDRVKIVLTPRPSPYSGQTNPDLLIAADEGDVVKARELLDQGADIETKDSSGDTPLMLAASSSYRDSGQGRVAMMLVDRGANVNARDNEGWSPLLFAAGQDQPDLVLALISKGADVNAKDEDRYTPLMQAVSRENVPNVKTLLAAGASVNATDDDGKTALIYAVESQNVEIVRALIDWRANLNATSNGGESALSYAVKRDLTEIVQLLKEAGAKR